MSCRISHQGAPDDWYTSWLLPLCQNVGCRLLDVSVHVGFSSPDVKMEQDVYAHFREQLTNDILAR